MHSIKSPLKILKKTIVGILIFSAIFSLGYVYGYNGYVTKVNKFPEVKIERGLPGDKKDLDFALFWRVWDTLYSKYYDKEKLNPENLVYGAISGMVAAVGDPYTVFLPPSENKVVQEDLLGNFEGVGIQIGFKGSQLAVIAPLPDSPAERAGIEAGDYIIGIVDETKGIDMGTSGITLPEAVQAIRGSKGSLVTLLLLRGDDEEPLEVDVVRDSIDVPSIVTEYVGKPSAGSSEGGQAGQDIAHVRILKFAGETMDEWDETVVELLTRKSLDGIIIDVRNNPGGYLQGAVELASDFLEIGDIAVIEEDADGDRDEYKVEKLGRLRNYDVVILINQGSASASEIFAGAMRDNKQVTLVGDTTFGKGTIQEPQQINGGSGLHITIARWLTPSGVWVNEEGLTPDIGVEDDNDTEEDEQLLEAIELLQ